MKSAFILAAGLLIVSAVGAAEAAPVCKVPKIETCQGCLKKVNVTPLPDGTCRVTYDVSPTALIPGSPGDVTIEMDMAAPAAPVLAPAVRTRRRAAVAKRWRAKPYQARRMARAAYRPSAGRNCFWFNGGRICE